MRFGRQWKYDHCQQLQNLRFRLVLGYMMEDYSSHCIDGFDLQITQVYFNI